MVSRLLNHCERYFGHKVAADKKILNDLFFVAPVKKSRVQIESSVETFISSKKPLSPYEVPSDVQNQALPDLFPLDEVVSIPKLNFYDERIVYRESKKDDNFKNVFYFFFFSFQL